MNYSPEAKKDYRRVDRTLKTPLDYAKKDQGEEEEDEDEEEGDGRRTEVMKERACGRRSWEGRGKKMEGRCVRLKGR